MRPALVRLVVAAVLFFGWIGWLAHLAFSSRDPIILYRPQFLVSSLDVIAEVEQTKDGRPQSKVTIRKVCWPNDPATKKLEGTGHIILDLPERPEEGWTGAGPYILPVVREGESFRIAPMPQSPGFPTSGRAGLLHIYRDTAQTRRQLEDIRKIEIKP